MSDNKVKWCKCSKCVELDARLDAMLDEMRVEDLKQAINTR